MNIYKRLGGAAYRRVRSFSASWLGSATVLPLPLVLCLALLAVGCTQSKHAEIPVPPNPKVVVTAENNQDLIAAARSNLGVRYKYGGNSPTTGFDCSGFICWTFEQVGVALPRSVREQAVIGQEIARSELQPGDIVVFKGTNHRSGWHAGIYTGEGRFIHSPRSGKTVTETALNTDYYNKHFYGARRIPRANTGMMMASAGNSRPAVLSADSSKTLVTATGIPARDTILHKPSALEERKPVRSVKSTKKAKGKKKSSVAAKGKAKKSSQQTTSSKSSRKEKAKNS